MNIGTSYSVNQKLDDAVNEISNELNEIKSGAVLYFGSSNFDPDKLSSKMQAAFGDIPVFGCTTSGEITSGKMLDDSVVAMGLNSKVVQDIKIEVLENIADDSNTAVEKAFKAFENYYGVPMQELDPGKHIGLILVDGLSGAEERVMDRIGDLTNVTFIGGSAGDNLKFKQTHVFANGKAYSNSALLVLIKVGVKFDFIKTQSFKSLNIALTATKVDEARREVIEFNNRPAVQEYASLLGIEAEKAPDYFMTNPVGLMVGDEPYVRSPQQVQGSSMIFYCNILENTELTLLQSENIIDETRKALEDKEKQFGSFSGIINFNCILRTLELKAKQQTDDYGKLFSEVPTVGFSTYGEEFIGHINQTATMLVFK